jgi:hypothetical protein
LADDDDDDDDGVIVPGDDDLWVEGVVLGSVVVLGLELGFGVG